MKAAIIENNIIVNVIEIPDTSAPEKFGGRHLPDGKWIGDAYQDPEQEPTSEPTVWDELDAAYQEGVSSAYDQ